MHYQMVELIQKKRDGSTLSEQEIRHIVEGFTSGTIPDYQMSAFAMAVYFQGMSEEETAFLTKAMAESGTQIDLSAIPGVKVDKHSTGGVGDTTTLVLAPLVASCGVPVAKMSGRGLGHTGGTIDKLESIAGFQVELSESSFIEQVKTLGIAITSQSGEIAPADKKLYALRDVTATVDSIPLIASSVMSKKIASGADAIVLDVKTGSGAFMKNENDAAALAETMVKIGWHVKRNTIAIISSMEQPLGYAIGNALEVREAIETLQGKGPEDLYQLSIMLGTQMLVAGNVGLDENAAKSLLEEHIQSGKALAVFKQWIRAQGGDDAVVDDVERLPQAAYSMEVKSSTSGTVSHIDAERIGRAAMRLGAGRETKDAPIDLTAGMMLHKKIGDYVEQGETIAILYTSDEQIAQRLQTIEAEVHEAYRLSNGPVERPSFIKAIVTHEGTRWF